ncbi:phosphotransferase [Actinoplanes sp. NPDC049265]|uniref:phosphotransferase n=1 Tax=Actinoplanes sp. NPDC049265 TaxID=3363902 RepID=UPI0037123D4F
MTSDLELLASGNEADVYALNDCRVLRRHRWMDDVSGEAELMAYVGSVGYPVPEVFAVHGGDMEMERLHGPTMAQGLISGEVSVAEGVTMLTGLLRRLHALPPLPGGTGRILHLDLHPENVVVTERGPVVIDWVNARDGEPDLDVALSALIMAMVATDDGYEWAAPAGEFVDAFLAAAPGDPFRRLDEAMAVRRRQLRLDDDTALEPAVRRMRGVR